MRVAILLLLLALSHQLDTARVRRQDGEDSNLVYDDYTDQGPTPECECVGKFKCYCVRNIQCLQNGTINFYGIDILPPRANIAVQKCPDGDTCCVNPKESKPVKPPALCGVRGTSVRLLGTNTGTEYGEFPWMLAIYFRNGTSWQFKCGASLLRGNIILTAAHCVKEFKTRPGDLRVRAGAWDLDATNEPVQELGVARIRLHEQYLRSRLLNDIALVKLSDKFKRQDSLGSVCIPKTSVAFPPGKRCIATGWGLDKYGSTEKFGSRLKQVEIPIVSKDDCERKLRRIMGQKFHLHDSFICAVGETESDTCKGDGGGPLVCEDGDQYFQAGIVSWGPGCGVPDMPGVYVDVAHFRDWMMSTIPQL